MRDPDILFSILSSKKFFYKNIFEWLYNIHVSTFSHKMFFTSIPAFDNNKKKNQTARILNLLGFGAGRRGEEN